MVDTTKTVDLLSLIEQRAPVRFKRAASTGGGEYHGNCPWCAGRDRFHCWPHADFPRYWCRGCQAKGDAIEFLREFEGLLFHDACAELGIEPGYANSYRGTASPLGTDPSPCKEWQSAAEDFIFQAMKALHDGRGKAYHAYLLARGITTETMLSKKIGYVPLKDGRWIETPFSRWGLTEDMLTADQWQKGCVRVPDGLLFPHFGPDNRPWKLTMYRPLAEQLPNMRRGQIVGSKECLLNEDKITQEKPVLMTESFLDALSVEQVAGDLVTAVSTDGTSGCRSLRLQSAVQYAPYVLQSFDRDEAGFVGAQWWCMAIENCVRWEPLAGSKDTNEMLVGGVDIRAWIHAGINNALRRPSAASTVEHSSSIVVEEPTEVAPLCVVCNAVVDSFTDQGTPTCEKHFSSRQTIEKALAVLAQEQEEQVLDAVASQVIEQPSSDPLIQFARTVDAIADVFAPCDIVRHDPAYTLQEHAAFMKDKKERERIVKEQLIWRRVRAARDARLHPVESMEAEDENINSL